MDRTEGNQLQMGDDVRNTMVHKSGRVQKRQNLGASLFITKLCWLGKIKDLCSSSRKTLVTCRWQIGHKTKKMENATPFNFLCFCPPLKFPLIWSHPKNMDWSWNSCLKHGKAKTVGYTWPPYDQSKSQTLHTSQISRLHMDWSCKFGAYLALPGS